MDATRRIVTGQQIGVGWTPALSVVKALAALAEARRLGGEALFWMADEDHDRLEVASVVAQTNGRLLHHRFPFEAPAGTSTGWLPWTGAHQRSAEALWGPLPAPTEPTLRGHFLALGAPLWARGIRPFSPVQPDLRQAIQPELERWRALDLEGPVHAQAEALRRSGISLDFDPTTQALWFSLDPRTGLRRRLEGGQALPSGAWLSPGALLRPLMQSLLLQPEAVVLGPAERAYWRLTEPLWEKVGLEPPRILPRPRAFILPPGLHLPEPWMEDLQAGRWDAFAPDGGPRPTDLLPALEPPGHWDPALARRFRAELAHTRSRLEALDRRQARDRAAAALGMDPERLRQRIFPFGRAQEQVLPGWAWLRDEALLDRMLEALASSPDVVCLEET